MNTRTNSLHRKLPPELRDQVEKDLAEQPQGRATYQEVWEYYGLGKLGVNIKAVQRWGKYVRGRRESRLIETEIDFDQARSCVIVSGHKVRISFDWLIKELRRLGALPAETMADNAAAR